MDSSIIKRRKFFGRLAACFLAVPAVKAIRPDSYKLSHWKQYPESVPIRAGTPFDGLDARHHWLWQNTAAWAKLHPGKPQGFYTPGGHFRISWHPAEALKND